MHAVVHRRVRLVMVISSIKVRVYIDIFVVFARKRVVIVFRFLVAFFCALIPTSGLVEELDPALLVLFVHKCWAVQFRKDEIFLLKNECRHVPVIYFFLKCRFRANSCNFIGSQHHLNHFFAEF